MVTRLFEATLLRDNCRGGKRDWRNVHVSQQCHVEAYVWGMYGGHFFCRVANFNALGIIEDSCLEVHAA